MSKLLNTKKGYTLVETVIYLAIFIAISSVIVVLLLLVLETNRKVSPINSLSRGAISALEVITKEIRNSDSIDVANSSWGTDNGILQLNTLDSGGNPKIVKFYLADGQILISENNNYLGPLNSNTANVTALNLDLISSGSQSLVKIELGLSAGTGKYQKSETFYSSVQLRIDN